jgi:hypothetical protein
MYIVLLQDGILYKYLSGPFDLWCHFNSKVSLWIFGLDDLSIGDREVLKSPTTIVLGSICVFKSSSVCLKKLSALTWGTYKLKIVYP